MNIHERNTIGTDRINSNDLINDIFLSHRPGTSTNREQRDEYYYLIRNWFIDISGRQKARSQSSQNNSYTTQND